MEVLAATTVRFDVNYGHSVLSRFLAKPNDKVINAAKRIIRYLVKAKDLGITWKVTPEDRNAGFADMTFGAVDAKWILSQVQLNNRNACHVGAMRVLLPSRLQQSRIDLVTLKGTIDRDPEFSRSTVCGAGRYNLRGEIS